MISEEFKYRHFKKDLQATVWAKNFIVVTVFFEKDLQ